MPCIVTRRRPTRPRLFVRASIPVVLLALALAGCGGSEEPRTAAGESVPLAGPAPTGSPDGGARRIVFLGDSISAGYGLPEDEAFPALIERELRNAGYDVEVINAGVSGDTSAGGLARLDWVLSGEPDLLVVELGGNDALRGQPLESTERNLRSIVTRGRAAGARVLLLGMDIPTNYGPEYGGGFAEIYPRVAADLDVALVPEFARTFGLDPRLMQADGLHPTAAGHRRLAELVLPAVRRLLDAP